MKAISNTIFVITTVSKFQFDINIVMENIVIVTIEPMSACLVNASITCLPLDQVIYTMKKKNSGAVHKNAPIFKNSGCVLNNSVKYVNNPKKKAPTLALVAILVKGDCIYYYIR